MEQFLLEGSMEDIGVCHGLIPSLMEISYLFGAMLGGDLYTRLDHHYFMYF